MPGEEFEDARLELIESLKGKTLACDGHLLSIFASQNLLETLESSRVIGKPEVLFAVLINLANVVSERRRSTGPHIEEQMAGLIARFSAFVSDDFLLAQFAQFNQGAAQKSSRAESGGLLDAAFLMLSSMDDGVGAPSMAGRGAVVQLL